MGTLNDAEQAQLAICWNCGARISTLDRYCRYCGKGQGRFVPWYYKHWGIIVLTMFLLGPFGLILVWRSPILSKEARIIYTGVILLLSWFIIYKIYGLWVALQSLFSGML